jgi:hypothetical protein
MSQPLPFCYTTAMVISTTTENLTSVGDGSGEDSSCSLPQNVNFPLEETVKKYI